MSQKHEIGVGRRFGQTPNEFQNEDLCAPVFSTWKYGGKVDGDSVGPYQFGSQSQDPYDEAVGERERNTESPFVIRSSEESPVADAASRS